MIELNGNLEDIIKELREAISQIKGVESISEDLDFTYIVEVSSESDKQNVETVGGLLSAQARRFGFSIEVVPFTRAEIEEGRKKIESFSGPSNKGVSIN